LAARSSLDLWHAQVAITYDVHQPERSLRGGHLDQCLDGNMAVLHQSAAPVAVGVHSRMRRRCTGDHATTNAVKE
jgi:hypothetical protein